MKEKAIIILMILAFATVSCIQYDIPSGSERRLRAGASFEGNSKGAVLTAVPDVFYLFAASYTGSVPGKTNYIYGEAMTRYSGGWISDNAYGAIPSERNVLYWAVAGGAGLTLPPASATGWPKLSYELPSNADAQGDIIVAQSLQKGSKESLKLPFIHILCAVDAKVAQDGAFEGRLLSVKMKNVFSEGIYTLGSGWSNVIAKKDIVSDIDVSFTEDDGGKDILCGASTLLLIPQTLPDDAQVEVTAVVDGENVSVSAPLTGVNVAAGHKAVLNLDLSELGRKILNVESVTLTEWKGDASRQMTMAMTE